jgi:hypothetical protein
MITKILALLFVVWFVHRISYFVYGYYEFLRLRKAGVPFGGNNTYSLTRDGLLLKKHLAKTPTTFAWTNMFRESLKTEKLPPIIGTTLLLGNVILTINSADLL